MGSVSNNMNKTNKMAMNSISKMTMNSRRVREDEYMCMEVSYLRYKMRLAIDAWTYGL